MSFKRLFSTELSQTAAPTDFTVNFGDLSTSATLPGVISTGALSADFPAVVKYVRYKIGEPVLTVHLDNRQIGVAFEDSNLKYSSIINTYQARSWMIQYYGLQNDFTAYDLTGKLPIPYSNFILRLSENIAWDMNPPVGGNVQGNIRKGYIQMETGKQDYDIYDDIVDNALSQPVSAAIQSLSGAANTSNITLKTIYHYPSVTLYRFYDPYSSINLLSQEFNFESFNVESIFYVLPIWTDILRAQQLNMSDKIRRSNFSYERVGRRLRIFPAPKQSMKLWIDYTTSQQNPFENPSNTADATSISNISQIPFTDIAYNKINAPGKYWIRDFTFAICLEIEGRIRRKFDRIPIPGDSITMDGTAMVAEAIAKQLELEKNLRDDLERLTVQSVMKDNLEIQQAEMAQQKMIPNFIYLY
jgi:hypothetical protein